MSGWMRLDLTIDERNKTIRGHFLPADVMYSVDWDGDFECLWGARQRDIYESKDFQLSSSRVWSYAAKLINTNGVLIKLK